MTGATTPFGQALCRALLAEPRVSEVVAVGREASDGGHINDARYRYVSTDLTRSRKVRDLLWGPARQCNAVVHAALHRSPTRVGQRAHRLNVDGTRVLLELAEEHPNIARFIFRSSGAVYRIDARQPAVIDERQPLNLQADAPQWIRDRVAADLTACTRMGMSPLKVVVLRPAECVAPHMGSQLYDYLNAPVCFRPLGYDPIINVISIADLVAATLLATLSEAQGIYNIPGRDTLSMAALIRLAGHAPLAAPGVLMAPLYRARAWVEGSEFRYDLNHWRFHFNGTLSGDRAETDLGYVPQAPVDFSSIRRRSDERAA